MWNPDAYKDTDYGLDEGESFEPVDDIDDEFVPLGDEPYVQTVLGPVRPDEVGVALVHEHLQWNPPLDGDADVDERITDVNASLLDLEAFFSASGRTIVSVTTPDSGRDAKSLVWLAQRSPVHIVGVAGFHHDRLLESYASGDPLDTLRSDLERDLLDGMDGTDAKPGLLKIGTSLNEITERERRAIEIIAEAQQRFHMPITTHTEKGTRGLEQVQLLDGLGVSPSMVIVGHLDFVEDDGYLREIAQSGAYLSFDQVGKPYYGPDDAKARRISRLVEEGYRDQILLSHDFARRSLLTGYSGRPGLSYIVEQFAVMLLEAGLEALDVRGMLVDNTSRALAVRRAEERIPA